MLAGGWGKPSGRIWHWTCWHKLASRPSICPLSFLFAHFKEWSSWLDSWLRLQFCFWMQGFRLTLQINVWCPNNHPDSWSLCLLEVSPCPRVLCYYVILNHREHNPALNQIGYAQLCIVITQLFADPSVMSSPITSSMSSGLEIQNWNSHPDPPG